MSFMSLSPPLPLPFAFGCAGHSPSRSLPSRPRTSLLGCPAGISGVLQGAANKVSSDQEFTCVLIVFAGSWRLHALKRLRISELIFRLGSICGHEVCEFGPGALQVLRNAGRGRFGRGGTQGIAIPLLPSHAGKTNTFPKSMAFKTCCSVFLPLLCLEGRRNPEYGREAGRQFIHNLRLHEGDVAPPEAGFRVIRV